MSNTFISGSNRRANIFAIEIKIILFQNNIMIIEQSKEGNKGWANGIDWCRQS